MRTAILILACLLLAIPCQAKIIIVDPNGSADYSNIQEAISNARDYDIVEVRQGTYNERINFYGKAITITSTNPDNINVVYATIIDGGFGENVVTFNNGEDGTSALVGLTIQNGDNGIYCFNSHPLIKKCVVRYANVSGIRGSSASPTILETIVKENTRNGIWNCNGAISRCKIIKTYSSGGQYGTPVASGLGRCNGPITDCIVSANGNVGLHKCNGQVAGCTISYNSRYGLDNCQGQILNCVVSGNGDAGVYFISGGDYSADVRNCTIIGNKGDGVWDSGGYHSITLANNIIVKNGGGVRGYSYSMNLTLKYNNVWHNLNFDYDGVDTGATDTQKNPLFAVNGYWDTDNKWVEGDYHLRSTAGTWNRTGWVNDEVTSPCIDAGDPCDSIASEPNPNGGRINQGAYGGTPEASKSPSGIIEPICTEYPTMDFNKDCKVNFEDFALFTQEWLDCNLDPPEACWE